MKKNIREKTIEDFVSYEPVTVSPETGWDELGRLLRVHRFRHLPVVENGRPVGIISDRDILMPRPMGVTQVSTARDVMTKEPYTVAEDASLEEVAFRLSDKKFSSAIVVDREGKVCGIFTATDALNALVELLRE